jgi:hypothetical protein
MSDKLAQKSDKCLFVGYPKETKGYYFYIPSENKLFVVRNGIFLEKDLIFKRISGSKVQLEEVRDSQTNVEPEMERQLDTSMVDASEIVTQESPRRSNRIHRELERYCEYLVTKNDDKVRIDDELISYQETMSSPDSHKWEKAMKAEIQSMDDNQVWNLIDPPEGLKTIGCKCVFKRKTDMHGVVQTY